MSLTLNDFPRRLRSYNQVQPFTVRDGETFLNTLESLRKYLRALIPELNAEMEGFISAVEDRVAALAEFYEQNLIDLKLYMEGVESLINETKELIEALPDLAEFTTEINDIAAQVSQDKIDAERAATEVDEVVGAVSVVRFGVVGDGVTDDSEAFRQALIAADILKRPVLIPEGMTVLTGITMSNINVIIKGGGSIVQEAGKVALAVTHDFGAPLPCVQGVKQYGPNSPGTTVYSERLSTIKVTDLDYTRFRAGDVYHLSSNDYYPWSMAALGNNNVWKAGFVPVHGVGIDLTSAGGAVTEGATIIGMTSGATAVLDSAIANGATMSVVAQSISANFAVGETVNVGGVPAGVVADVYMVSSALLNDNYVTQPRLRKVQTDKTVDVDVQIRAKGNPESLNGVASRVAALSFNGVYNARVRATVHGAWSRAVQFTSCYMGSADVRVGRLPNHALLTEQAYGYGVEVRGASEGLDVQVIGRNMRHAFTTNPTATTYGNNIFSYGSVKNITVHDSIAINPYAQGFDTHEGSYGVEFNDCRTIGSASSGRYQTSPVGFVNRGFNTTFLNCRAEDCITGFIEAGVSIPNDYAYVNRYEGCVSERYSRYGYYQDVSAIDGNSRIDIIDCDMRGDGSAQNAPYYQAGYYIRGGVQNIVRCRASRFNGAPIQAVASSTALGEVTILGFIADYLDCPASAGGLRVQGAAATLNIADYVVRLAAGFVLAGIFRSTQSDHVWNLAGDATVFGGDAPLFQVEAGVPVFNRKTTMPAVRPSATRGNANAVLHPRNDAPTQVWNTPLSGARTVTFTATVLAVPGDTFRIVRTAAATGAAMLTVLGKDLAPGSWCDVHYREGAWELAASGNL